MRASGHGRPCISCTGRTRIFLLEPHPDSLPVALENLVGAVGRSIIHDHDLHLDACLGES